MIAADGGHAYAEHGVGRSRGTQVFQLAGNIARGGIVETAFGITLGELVEEYGGGTAAAGRSAPSRSGARSAPTSRSTSSTCRWTTRRSPRPARWSATAASWSSTTPSTWPSRRASRWSSAPRSRAASARRAGSARGAASRSIDRIIADQDREPNLVLLDDLCEVMTDGSLCAMGGLTPMPVRSAIRHFAEDFGRPGTTPAPAFGRADESDRHADRHPAPTQRSAWHRATTNPDHRQRERHHESARGTRLRDAGPRRRTVELEIDGRTVSVPAGTSVMRAAAQAGIDIPKLCATDSLEAFGSCRLCVVEVDGVKGTPGVLHDARGRGHGGPHPEREARAAAPQRHGAVHLRPPARLPDLRRQRRLRAAGHGRRQSGLRDVRYGYAGENHLDAPKDTSTRTSTSTRASASSARAACARATRCRARSR